MRLSHLRSLQDLKVIGLDTERSHAIGGAMVRIYFRLSGPPPLGWSYIFTTTWNAGVHSLKRSVGVDSDRIWIDCTLEEVETYHGRLESAVAQTNAKYREAARQQAINASHQAESEARLRLKLQDLSQALYPADEPIDNSSSPRFLSNALVTKLSRILSPSKRRRNHD